jgi:hypothetical protein
MFRIIATLLICLSAAFWNEGAPAQVDGQLARQLQQVIPDEPLQVEIGVKITQITNVDQKSENFGVVARVLMRWHDDSLAFDVEDGRGMKTMSGDDFLSRAREAGVNVPASTIENQQARSFDKAAAVSWFAGGTALYTNETIVTLQAPDFDFTHFPFDRQSFYFRIISSMPSDFVQFVAHPDANGLGDTLGEEEWVVEDVWTEVDEVEGLSGLPSSRFSLGFSAKRHLFYYWARIFVPLALLMGVAWANLFLEEYRRRIDIASGNLLAFIALNFTISAELPRLGYVTFLDALLMVMFVVTAGAVVYNVSLRRAAVTGHEARARAIDWHVTHWGFPVLLFGAVFAVYAKFFLFD